MHLASHLRRNSQVTLHALVGSKRRLRLRASECQIVICRRTPCHRASSQRPCNSKKMQRPWRGIAVALVVRMALQIEKSDDRRILVADGNAAIRNVLSNMLTAWGYSVLSAADGTTTWNILRSENGPRLAIIDWSMTGLEGVEVCRRIRADAGLNYIYMIILTSRTRSEDLMDAMEAGADDCIAKPFCSQELRARLLAGFRIIRLQERLISAREELYEQATRDGLTGLWNRKNIVEIVGNEFSRARRSTGHLAIVMADIDRFKRINDRHGHLAGDAVLLETSRRMKAAVRQYDSVGRYGGEEFLVVLNNCDASRSLVRAEEIRRAIASAPVQTIQGPIPVTMSLGVLSSKDWELRPVEELLREVDAALYKAKAAGRNCVQFANPHAASSVPTKPLEEQPKSAR